MTNPFSPREGSSRPAGLFRIGLVLLLWTSWGNSTTVWASGAPDRLLIDASFWVSTALLLVGLWTPFAAVWTAGTLLVMYIGFGVYGDMDDWVHHHTWLLVCSSVLLVLTPSGRSYSIDRWRALNRGEDPPERGWLGGMQLMTLLLTTVYLWSAWDKSSWAFLSGERLQAIFLHLFLENVPEGAWVTWVFGAMGVTVVAFEYVMAFGIHVPRLHWWLLPTGIVVHALFYLLLPVGVFSSTMILLYLAVLDPEAVHRAIDRLHRDAPSRSW